MAGQIGNGGMAAAGATFIAMMAIWFAFPNSRGQVLLAKHVVMNNCSTFHGSRVSNSDRSSRISVVVVVI